MGGSVGNEDDLWNHILEQLSGYTNCEASDAEETTATLKGEVEGEIGVPLITKAKTNIGIEHSQRHCSDITKSISLTPRAAAISQLQKAKIPLISDMNN